MWFTSTIDGSKKKDKAKCGSHVSETPTHCDTDTKSHLVMHCEGVWLRWEAITELPVIGVSSSSGCADISMVTLPSGLDLSRLTETGQFSASMALTVYSVASKAGSTGTFWSPSPCSAQLPSSSCSHRGGSGMSVLKRKRKISQNTKQQINYMTKYLEN